MPDLKQPHAVPTDTRWIGADRVTVPARSIVWPRTSTDDGGRFLGAAMSFGYPVALDVAAPSSLLVDRPGVTHRGDVVAYAYGWSFIVGEAPDAPAWVCPQCGFHNAEGSILCHGCGWDSSEGPA